MRVMSQKDRPRIHPLSSFLSSNSLVQVVQWYPIYIYTSNVRDVLVLAGVTSAMYKRNHCLAKNICHRHGQTPTNSSQQGFSNYFT